jgi:hypothetical protein
MTRTSWVICSLMTLLYGCVGYWNGAGRCANLYVAKVELCHGW